MFSITQLLSVPPDLAYFTKEVPILSSTNWMQFKPAMEIIFIGSCAEYLIDSTPSTIIPPECFMLDQQLLIHLLSRVEDQFRPLMQIEKKSTLLAWTNLTSYFQKSFPASIVVNQQPSLSHQQISQKIRRLFRLTNSELVL